MVALHGGDHEPDPRRRRRARPRSATPPGPGCCSAPACAGAAAGMSTHVELRAGAYADSVTLLQVSRTVQGVDGVSAAQVAMATPLNLEVLEQMGFASRRRHQTTWWWRSGWTTPTHSTPPSRPSTRPSPVRRAGTADAATRAPHRTTAAALRELPADTLVLVSVPGASATVEAMDALDAGRDVMVFSDNVPVEQEVALKRVAAERGLLVMGPDCGTAVVDGVGLGFANAVAPGPVGIVAASGTGCQQLLAPPRPRRCRGRRRPRGRRPRPFQRRRRTLHPRGDAPARRRPGRRAGRRGLEAARGRRRRRDPGLRRDPEHPGRVRAARTRSARPDRGRRTGAHHAGPRRPGLARPGRRRSRARLHAPGAVRRRHAARRGDADRRGTTAVTTWSTSATTSSRRAARTR